MRLNNTVIIKHYSIEKEDCYHESSIQGQLYRVLFIDHLVEIIIFEYTTGHDDI